MLLKIILYYFVIKLQTNPMVKPPLQSLTLMLKYYVDDAVNSVAS